MRPPAELPPGDNPFYRLYCGLQMFGMSEEPLKNVCRQGQIRPVAARRALHERTKKSV
jgi:hypothetical protein